MKQLQLKANMTQSKIVRHTFLTTGSMLIGIFALPLLASAAEKITGDPNRGRVIYNLDSTEFFVDTFGPVVPETTYQFVDTHAAAYH